MAHRCARATAGIAAVAALAAAAILGWGYWHGFSHAALHVSLYDIALKNDRQAYGRVAAAQVVFNDAAGNVLARGRVEPPHGVFSIDHPAVGDCRREERAASASAEAMRAWKSCFEAQSRWLPTWVRQVRSADIELAGCRIARTSVLLEESSDDWWLWWVPSPHIGGAPYTHFQASVWIDARACGSRAGN